jgi:hypothetical protein
VSTQVTALIAGGNYNVVVGDEAGTAITTGDQNVAVGYSSGKAVDTGVANVLVGSSAGTVLTDANYNKQPVGSTCRFSF